MSLSVQTIAWDSPIVPNVAISLRSKLKDHMGVAASPIACWLCGKAVKLEECKIDEHGLSVHEKCYLARVGLEQAARTPVGKAKTQ